MESDYTNRELGVVDIGSNSVRLVIYDIFGAHFTPIYNEKILAGLGRDLKATGCLSEEGKSLTLQALQRFSQIAAARNLPPLVFGATAALRVADDAPEFIKHVATETGLNITPISGDEEARLTALGLVSTHPRANGLAADLGGASLELIDIGRNNNGAVIGQRQSLPLGPFDLIGNDLTGLSLDRVKEIKKDIKRQLNDHYALLQKGKNQTLYLIGGAWRNFAAIHQSYCDYPLKTLQSYAMKPEAALKHARWVYGEGEETVLTWPGMRQRRAETLPYSAILLEVLLELVEPETVVISQSGLREGLIHDSISLDQQQTDPLFDGCRAFAKGSLQTEGFGNPLFEFMKSICTDFPVAFNPEDDERLLKAACLMAGVGKDLHPDHRADASFAAVLYAPVAGLTHQERAFLALCLFRSFSSSRGMPAPDVISTLLTPDQRKVAHIIGSTIRLAFVATGRSSTLLEAFLLSVDNGTVVLSVSQQYDMLLTEQVKFRVSKLANKMKLDFALRTHQS